MNYAFFERKLESYWKNGGRGINHIHIIYEKKIAWSNDEVFAISWLCNRYLDICRLKKRQARSAKVMIAKWRLHGSRVRLSNQLACDLDLACETRKRRDDRFKISSIHYFFPFSTAFSPPCSCSLFSTNFFSHAFLNHYSHIIFTMKNREIEITVQKSKKYRLSSIHLVNSKRISELQRRID